MEDLKQALVDSPALRAIDYDSADPVVLAVDTSRLAVGFHLCQEDEGPPPKKPFSLPIVYTRTSTEPERVKAPYKQITNYIPAKVSLISPYATAS